MTKYILIILVLFSFKGYSQTSPSGFPTQANTGWTQWGYQQSTLGTIVAKRDTTFLPRFNGTIVFRPQNIRPYFYDSTALRWYKLFSEPDTLTTLATRYDLTQLTQTTLSNIGAGFRWVATSDGQIKTAAASNTILWDSTSTANTLTAKADTSVLVTQYDLSAMKEQVIGSLYQNTNFTSTTGFFNNGTTVAATGGHLAFTGGSATYAQSLELDSLHALDSWVVGGIAKIVTVGSSPGWGVKGRSTGGGNSCFAVFNTSTGKIDLILGASTLLTSSVGTIAFTAGVDSIELIVELDKTILSAKARNKTTNSTAITVQYNFVLTSTTLFLPNTGRFAIFPSGTGGAFDVDSFSVFSKVVKNAALVLVGDSKTRGNSVTTEGFRFGDLLNNFNRSTAITGGPSDKIEDYIARHKEILLVSGVNTKVLICGASNNIRVGQDSATYTHLYDSLVTILTTAGLNVYHTTGFYESGVNQNAFRNHIYAVYAANKIIETLTPTSESGLLFTDNIHPNDAGHYVIYNTIVKSNKLSPSNTTYDAGNTVIRNQDIVEQSAKFKLFGFGNVMNGTNTPALSTPTLKINTGTTNSAINLSINVNHATNQSMLAFQRRDTTSAFIGLSLLNSNPYDLTIRGDRGNIVFGANSTEYSRMDLLGNFYVNTTSTVLSSKFTVRQSASIQAIAAFDGQRTGGSYTVWSTNGTFKGLIGTGDFITGAASDDMGIRSENGKINFSHGGTLGAQYRSGEINVGNLTDQGPFTLQNTGGLYQNGTFRLQPVVAPPGSYIVLVRSLTSDSAVYGVPSSTFATGNTLYTGDGTLAGNRSVNANNLNLTFSDVQTFRINHDVFALSKADGTFPYSNVIVAPNQQWWLGYTPTVGSFSKGSAISIDTNNNVALGTSTPPTTAPLYADGAAYLHGLQSGRGNFYRVSDFSADHTMTNTEYWANIDASGGNVTITLPAASTVFGSSMGIQYVFKRTDASANTVTIQRNATPGTDLIDGAASFTIVGQYTVKEVQCVSTSAYAIR